jgi:hypothetical protein
MKSFSTSQMTSPHPRAPAHRSPALKIVAFTMALAMAVWLSMPTEAVRWLMREEGPVETTTAVLFFLLALGLYWLRPEQDDRCSWLSMAILCAACGAREMDWHRAWTGKSVLKISFYLGPAPMHQKLVVLAALMLVAVCAIHLLRRHALRLWRGMRASEPVAVTVATLLVTTGITKILDRSVNLLANDHGIVATPPIRALVSALEESMELGLPLMVTLALWQYLRPRHARSKALRHQAAPETTVGAHARSTIRPPRG